VAALKVGGGGGGVGGGGGEGDLWSRSGTNWTLEDFLKPDMLLAMVVVGGSSGFAGELK